MKKQLNEMTLEELWQLFPIVLEPHRDCWTQWYAAEEKQLWQLLPETEVLRISHIGSTAVSAIWAKPIVDILVETADRTALQSAAQKLERGGYLRMSEEQKRISLNKGYTPEGFAERVFHVHVRLVGDHDELYFRDYLEAYPDVAKEYETLKQKLWNLFEHDRDAYTQDKTEFVRRYTGIAKEQYHGRYTI